MSKQGTVSNDMAAETAFAAFATATYTQVQTSGPPSPPLGFSRWTVRRAERVTASLTGHNERPQQQPHGAKVQVLRQRQNYKQEPSYIHGTAYLLPGKTLKETLCGKIVQCEVLRYNPASITTTTNNNTGQIQIIEYCKTGQWVAIKMDSRTTVRRLHHGTQAPSENPWKEVAALELMQGQPQELSSSTVSTIRNNTNQEQHHVVSLLEALVDDAYLYEVLPYYAGGSLYEYMHQHPQGLPECQAQRYFGQILQAIYYIHSRGVCHCDISTHNLMLDRTQQFLYLIDFALALRIPHSYPDDNVTADATDVTAGTTRRILHTVRHVGKLAFMAPEMYQQEDFDGLAVDLWSAAVVLFVMLTGRPVAYHKPDAKMDSAFYDLCDKRFYWDPTSVAQVYSWGHAVSPAAVDLLHHMLAIDPTKRLTLAQVMRHEWVTKQKV